MPPAAGDGGLADGLRKRLGTPAPAPSTNPFTPPVGANAGSPAASPAMPAAPASDPANWRKRIAIVRLEDAKPQPGEATAAPGPLDKEDLKKLPSDIKNLEEQMVDSLRQITDADTAKRLAPQWADVTSQGLDGVAKLRHFGGVPKPDAGSQPSGAPTGGLRVRLPRAPDWRR